MCAVSPLLWAALLTHALSGVGALPGDKVWYRGSPGLSCDDVCSANEMQCTESMWPLSEEEFSTIAVQHSLDLACDAVILGGFFEAPVRVVEPASGKIVCAWQGPDRVWSSGQHSVSARCSRKAHLNYSRVCPCRSVRGGGMLGWKNFSSAFTSSQEKKPEETVALWWEVNGPLQHVVSGVETVKHISTALFDIYYTHVNGVNMWTFTPTLDQNKTCYDLTAYDPTKYTQVPVPADEEVVYLASTDLDVIAVTRKNVLHRWSTGRAFCLPHTEILYSESGDLRGVGIRAGPTHRTGTVEWTPATWNPDGGVLSPPGTPATHAWLAAFDRLTSYPDDIPADSTRLASGEIHSVTTTHAAACVLMADGTISAFGSSSSGGQAPPLTSVKQVFASRGAFAALLQNGTVVAWGNGQLGGELSPNQATPLRAMTVVATEAAFVAFAVNTAPVGGPVFPGTVHAWGGVEEGGDVAVQSKVSASVDNGSCAASLWKDVHTPEACSRAAQQLAAGGVAAVSAVEETEQGNLPTGCLYNQSSSRVLFNTNREPVAVCYWEEPYLPSTTLSDNWYQEEAVASYDSCQDLCCRDASCGAGTFVTDASGRSAATCRLYHHDGYDIQQEKKAAETPAPPTEAPQVPIPDYNGTTNSSSGGNVTDEDLDPIPGNTTTLTPTLTQIPTPTLEPPLNVTYTSFTKVGQMGRVCATDGTLEKALTEDPGGIVGVFATTKGFLAVQKGVYSTQSVPVVWPVSPTKSPLLQARPIKSVHGMEESFVIVSGDAKDSLITTTFSPGAATGFHTDHLEPVGDVRMQDVVDDIRFTLGSAAVVWGKGGVDTWQAKTRPLERFMKWSHKGCRETAGAQRKSYVDLSVSDCAQRCLELPGCTGFEFSDKGRCALWLHGACSRSFQPVLEAEIIIKQDSTDLYILNDLNLVVDENMASSVSMTLVGKGECKSVGVYEEPVASKNANSSRECRGLCLTFPSLCTGVQYNAISGECLLFNVALDYTYTSSSIFCYKVREKTIDGYDVVSVADSYSQYDAIVFGLTKGDVEQSNAGTIQFNRTSDRQDTLLYSSMIVMFNESRELVNMVTAASLADYDDGGLYVGYVRSVGADAAASPRNYWLQLYCDGQARGDIRQFQANDPSCLTSDHRGVVKLPLIYLNHSKLRKYITDTVDSLTNSDDPAVKAKYLEEHCGFAFVVNQRCSRLHKADNDAFKNGWFQNMHDWTCPLPNLLPDDEYVVLDARDDITSKEQCAVACQHVLSPERCTSFVYPHNGTQCVLILNDRQNHLCLTNASVDNPRGMMRAQNSNWWVHQSKEFSYNTVQEGRAMTITLGDGWMPGNRVVLDRAECMKGLDFGDQALKKSLGSVQGTGVSLVSSNTFFSVMLPAGDGQSLLLPDGASPTKDDGEGDFSLITHDTPPGVEAFRYYVGELRYARSGVDLVVAAVSSLALVRFGTDHTECKTQPCRLPGSGIGRDFAVCADQNTTSSSSGDFICACRYVPGESVGEKHLCREEEASHVLIYIIVLFSVIFVFCMLHYYIRVRRHNQRRLREAEEALVNLYQKHASEVEVEAMRHMLSMNEGHELELLNVMVPNFGHRMHEARLFLLHQRRLEFLPVWGALPHDLVRRVHDFILGLDTMHRMQPRLMTPFGVGIFGVLRKGRNQRVRRKIQGDTPTAVSQRERVHHDEEVCGTLWTSDLMTPLVPVYTNEDEPL